MSTDADLPNVKSDRAKHDAAIARLALALSPGPKDGEATDSAHSGCKCLDMRRVGERAWGCYTCGLSYVVTWDGPYMKAATSKPITRWMKERIDHAAALLENETRSAM